MSQNRRSDDGGNGSRRHKESEHESTTVSEFLAISQLEHGNPGSQTNNNGSEDLSSAVSDLVKAIESRVIRAVQHSIKPVIEDSIRRVAKEVIEAELEKFRSSGIEMHSPTKSLELRFRNNISLPVWTGFPIEGEEHKPLELALFDSETGQIVNSGPEASAEFEVFLLQGDLERNAVEECKGKNSLLKGNTNLKLNKGIGSLGGISFKHKSKWTKKCKLRLGARIVDPVIRMRVKEAKTEPFTINDKRVKSYEKHDCPSLSDPVWRLRNIDRRGICYQHLSEQSIKTVQEFLTELNLNPQGLQKILGSTMSPKMIEETVANAMKCELDDRIFHYSPSSQQAYCVFFNVVGQLRGVRFECVYVLVDQLPETEKARAQEMVASAFKHREEVSCLDKNSLGCDSSDLSNVLRCSDLHRPESTSGHNSGDYPIMINETDSARPDNSLPYETFNMIDGNDTNRPPSSDLGIVESHIFQPDTAPMMSPLNLHEFGFQTPSLQLDEIGDLCDYFGFMSAACAPRRRDDLGPTYVQRPMSAAFAPRRRDDFGPPCVRPMSAGFAPRRRDDFGHLYDQPRAVYARSAVLAQRRQKMSCSVLTRFSMRMFFNRR